MFKLKVLTLCALYLVKGQNTDRTRVPNASGSDVVEAVANLIREACIFPNDKLYLRRLAYVETMDGIEVTTYRPNYYGGIWQVDQDMFDQIATANVIDKTKQMIKQQLAIDWSNVQWSDLLKPLYSGLAAALFNLLKAGSKGIPRGIEYQADFWVNTSRPKQQAQVFLTKANKRETGCTRTNALDLVFALDSSTSMTPQDFEIAKQFVTSIVDSFENSPSKTEVGVLVFSTTVKIEFTLNQYSTSDAIKIAIEGVQYRSGATHTDEAISYAVNNMFTPSSGVRNGSSKVLVIVTDGRADNDIETVRVASDAKAKGITIFAIGVTQQVNESELNSVASLPTCTHVQILNKYADLDSLKAEIEQELCIAPAFLTPNTYVYGCNSAITVQILPNVNGGTTVTVLVYEGEVEVFGSLATSNPNYIINDFYSLSTVTAPTSFFIKGNKQVALALISNKVSSCRSNFTVTVEEGQKARPNNHLLCIEDIIMQHCSAETLHKSPYIVISQAKHESSSIIGPVAGGVLGGVIVALVAVIVFVSNIRKWTSSTSNHNYESRDMGKVELHLYDETKVHNSTNGKSPVHENTPIELICKENDKSTTFTMYNVRDFMRIIQDKSLLSQQIRKEYQVLKNKPILRAAIDYEIVDIKSGAATFKEYTDKTLTKVEFFNDGPQPGFPYFPYYYVCKNERDFLYPPPDDVLASCKQGDRRGYIIISVPDQKDIDNFWIFITKNHVACIVLLSSETEKEQKTVVQVKLYKTTDWKLGEIYPSIDTMCKLLDIISSKEHGIVALVGSNGNGFSVCGNLGLCHEVLLAVESGKDFNIFQIVVGLKDFQPNLFQTFPMHSSRCIVRYMAKYADNM